MRTADTVPSGSTSASPSAGAVFVTALTLGWLILPLIEVGIGLSIRPVAYAGWTVVLVALAGLLWFKAQRRAVAAVVCAGGLVPMVLVTQWQYQSRTVSVETREHLQASYENGLGRFEVDLTSQTGRDALAGRALAVEATVGAVEVLLPPDVDVRVVVASKGPVRTELFGETTSVGRHARVVGEHDTVAGDRALSIRIRVVTGLVRVSVDEP